jgi:hypothetical protein
MYKRLTLAFLVALTWTFSVEAKSFHWNSPAECWQIVRSLQQEGDAMGKEQCRPLELGQNWQAHTRCEEERRQLYQQRDMVADQCRADETAEAARKAEDDRINERIREAERRQAEQQQRNSEIDRKNREAAVMLQNAESRRIQQFRDQQAAIAQQKAIDAANARQARIRGNVQVAKSVLGMFMDMNQSSATEGYDRGVDAEREWSERQERLMEYAGKPTDPIVSHIQDAAMQRAENEHRAALNELERLSGTIGSFSAATGTSNAASSPSLNPWKAGGAVPVAPANGNPWASERVAVSSSNDISTSQESGGNPWATHTTQNTSEIAPTVGSNPWSASGPASTQEGSNAGPKSTTRRGDYRDKQGKLVCSSDGVPPVIDECKNRRAERRKPS